MVVVDAPSNAPGTLAVAFVVPLQGPTGIYGPSCVACGQLAAEELNATTGVGGRRLELVLVDGGREPEVVAADVEHLVSSGAEAVLGWHTSAVRGAITARIGGEVVYVYAAMHEGHDDTPGLFMLGEFPANQVLPAVAHLADARGVRRWAVVGNDYVFPRESARVVRAGLEAGGADGAHVVSEIYVPLGTEDFSDVLRGLTKQSDAVDGVLMLLMGTDAVHFNRQFAAAGLDASLVRLSPAVEENTLLGAGAGAHHDLFAAAAWFENLDTPEATELARRHAERFGEWAPTMNAVGESCYEAVHFLQRLASECGGVDVDRAATVRDGWFYGSPRGLVRLRGNLVEQDVWLAVADGVQFSVTEKISGTA